jgi:limonene-1,2-epoxide hydrolase
MQNTLNVTEFALPNDKTPEIVGLFIQLYQKLNKDNLQKLTEVYSSDVHFQDPLHQVDGMAALTEYFANLYQNITHIEFDIHQIVLSECQHQAALYWVMSYSHPKLNKGQTIHVDGSSLLKFNDKIYFHRDYFDAGQMLYQHVPLLGGLINLIKKRIG